MNILRFVLGCVLAANVAGRAAESLNPLWQIGQADHSGAEFALAPTNYSSFLERFGSPDRAYYIVSERKLPVFKKGDPRQPESSFFRGFLLTDFVAFGMVGL